MITARLSGELRKLSQGQEEVQLVASDIGSCIKSLDEQFPGASAKVCDEAGEVLDSINVYVNGDNIRSLRGLATALKDGDEIDFMSAFAAG